MDDDNFFSADNDNDKENPLEKGKTSSFTFPSVPSSSSRSNSDSASSSQSSSTTSASSSADSSEKSDVEDDEDEKKEEEKIETYPGSGEEKDDLNVSTGKDTLSQMLAAASVQEFDVFESGDNIRKVTARRSERVRRGETLSSLSSGSNNGWYTSASSEDLGKKPTGVKIDIRSRSNGGHKPRGAPSSNEPKRSKSDKIRFDDTFTMTTSSSSSSSSHPRNLLEHSFGDGGTSSRLRTRPKSGKPVRSRGTLDPSVSPSRAYTHGINSLAGRNKCVSRVIQMKERMANMNSEVNDVVQRATLTQAVYEEWYFSKASSIRARRNAEMERKREEKERMEEERNKKQQRVEAALLEWEEGKVLQKKKQRRKAREDAEKLKEEERKKEKKLERVPEVYEAWKKEKAEKDRVKKEIRREEKKSRREAAQKKEARRQEALKVFETWATQKDSLLKERRRSTRRAEAELSERKRLEEEDRRVAAVAVFNAWKEDKDHEDECKRELMSGDSMRRAEKRKQIRTARSLEALEAYKAWLDETEVRHPVIQYEEARSTILANARPPWCPGGSKNVVMNY